MKWYNLQTLRSQKKTRQNMQCILFFMPQTPKQTKDKNKKPLIVSAVSEVGTRKQVFLTRLHGLLTRLARPPPVDSRVSSCQVFVCVRVHSNALPAKKYYSYSRMQASLSNLSYYNQKAVTPQGSSRGWLTMAGVCRWGSGGTGPRLLLPRHIPASS